MRSRAGNDQALSRRWQTFACSDQWQGLRKQDGWCCLTHPTSRAGRRLRKPKSTKKDRIMTQLTISDQTTAGETTGACVLDLLTERITVRELIRSRVYQEVQDYNVNQGWVLTAWSSRKRPRRPLMAGS